MKFKKPKAVELIEVNAENCTGCGNCVKKCKLEVFELIDKKAVAIHPKRCVGCGKCVKMCNFEAINLKIKK